MWVDKPYPYKWVVKFSLSIITTTLWESNYSDYQQYLFNRICEYKENFLTPNGYRKISKIFNDEGLKTPRNTEFTNSKVPSDFLWRGGSDILESEFNLVGVRLYK